MSNPVFKPEQAAKYYDDASISTFYEHCWGGDDIHIGRYATGNETVKEASAAMTRHLLDCAGIEPGQEVLEIACGFGGTLRALARLGCRVRGIDISENCVDHARKNSRDAGLDDRIDVAVGDFHDIDSDPGAWDAVVCQEAIIHSYDRPRVFTEAYRVLRPGGVFAVSDIVTGEDADVAKVEAAFERIGASADATVHDYAAMAESAGFVLEHVEERQGDIRTHYDKLADQLAQPGIGIDAEAVARIAKSVSNWRAALAGGDISWACFVARKPVEAS